VVRKGNAPKNEVRNLTNTKIKKKTDSSRSSAITGHAQLIVNGHVTSTNVSLNDGHWSHLCASWTSVGGEWKVFVNGTLRAAGHGLATDTYILTGGLLVLGIVYLFTFFA